MLRSGAKPSCLEKSRELLRNIAMKTDKVRHAASISKVLNDGGKQGSCAANGNAMRQ